MPGQPSQREYCDQLVDAAERSVTVYRHRRGKHFIFEHVPARVCTGCAERYFSARVVREMDRLIRAGKQAAPTVPVPVIELGAVS